MQEKINALESALGNLRGRDHAFAASLIEQYARKRQLSAKQIPYVDVLLEKATSKATVAVITGADRDSRVKTAIGSLSGVTRLFEVASRHVHSPAIVVRLGEHTYRLSLAGINARVPGSINVIDVSPNSDRKWYGRLLKDGMFEASPRDKAPDDLVPQLQRFACDPVGVAREHGRITGRCCFCNITLKDERSTAVGYGPICADHYELPWGDTSGAIL